MEMARRSGEPGEFWPRLAWTVGLIAAYRALFHIHLPGIDRALLRYLMNPLQAPASYEGVARSMSGLRSVSMMVLGIVYYPVSLGIVFIARRAIRRLDDRISARGWPEAHRWAERITIAVTAMAALPLLSFLGTAPDRRGAMRLVPDPGLVSFYLPGLAILSAGTAIALVIARAIDKRGFGHGMLTLLGVNAVFRLIPQALYVPVVLKQGNPPGMVYLAAAAFLGVVVATGVAVAGERRLRLMGKSRTGNAVSLPLCPASVWPVLCAAALAGCIPDIARSTEVKSVATLFSGGFALFVLQLGIMAALWGPMARTVTNPGAIAGELKRRGAILATIRPGRRTLERLEARTGRLWLAGFAAMVVAIMFTLLADGAWREVMGASTSMARDLGLIAFAAAGWHAVRSAREALRKDASAIPVATVARPVT